MSLVRVPVAAIFVPAVFPAATACLSVGPQAAVDPSLPAVGPPGRAIAPTQGRQEITGFKHTSTCSMIY